MEQPQCISLPNGGVFEWPLSWVWICNVILKQMVCIIAAGLLPGLILESLIAPLSMIGLSWLGINNYVLKRRHYH